MKQKVKFNNVSKKYSLYKNNSDKLFDFLPFRNKNVNSFYALRNISFEVYEGETIGVVGTNGSGKSTLSNLLTQIIPPTSGTIEINGEPSLIAINVGLKNNLTGLENIKLKCLMHGLNNKEIEQLTPSIVEFADIGDFIDQPVKNYSSGMKSRLGFAISVHSNPDVLVIDEALSVGDQTFYQKCINKINEFKAQGKTIFFVSHSLSQIKQISDRVLWIHFGRIKEFGDKNVVIENYQEYINWFNKLNHEQKKAHKKELLKEQMTDYPMFQRPVASRDNRKQKNEKIIYSLQICLLVLCVIISASLMFFDPFTIGSKAKDSVEKVTKAEDNLDEKKNKEEDNSNQLAQTINKSGIVKSNQVDVFADDKLIEKVGEIPFAKEVQVVERIDQVVKINVDNNIEYIEESAIEILDVELKKSNLTMGDFSPLFPEKLSNSYQFFASQLSKSHEEVLNSLNGLTDEIIDEEGNKQLVYRQENVMIGFNQEDSANAIIATDISDDGTALEPFLNESALQSVDGQRYLILTNDYRIVINLDEKTITFKII